ncbi:hypothetical protein PUNSTDRAFT_128032 [Punctularia strigosozonata HHB-11173 SS5]|uniref:Uncharacterized protein n=1 Tax=Punctularia strigosozonata (strain HHB-11173) TaxID=741275 RepID=R7S5X6_PUNST|nr:uncharacterized protein PUNSTDRAFT_128032 [Punctularia strigosozonata HHB-11173 SS5]EIN05231.1 hypothetical protein PUNSTDRAFT_128032 [Punctularia strigosozonata HHB-11173 SS5]
MDLLGKTVGWTPFGSSKDKGKAPQSQPQPERPRLRVELSPRQSFGPPPSGPYVSGVDYGEYDAGMLPDNSLERVAEDEEDEWNLEERGLYPGSYPRLVLLYTIVPIVSALLWILLAFLPRLLWPSSKPPPSSRAPYLPFPLPELLLSSALWSLCHHLRSPLYTLASLLALPLYRHPRLSSALTALFSAALHTLFANLVRVAAVPLLLSTYTGSQPPRADWTSPAFWHVWWLALGWALADACAGVAQGYVHLSLYKDVLVPSATAEHQPFLGGAITDSPVARISGSGESFRDVEADGRHDGNGYSLPPVVEEEVERDLDQLVALKAREDIEEVYGVPFIRIPVFISCLQRVDSILLSLGLTLLLSASYLRSTASVPPPRPQSPLLVQSDAPSTTLSHTHTAPGAPTSNRAIAITFPVVVALHAALALVHSPPVLARVGVHVAAYAGLLFALGMLFAGLAMWGAVS